MAFIPNLAIKQQMLSSINEQHIDDLFSDIPKHLRIKKLKLADGLSQSEVERKLNMIARKNRSCTQQHSFLGGGIKSHYIPAVVKALTHRAEFYTAYTPYQSEASQGFLQAMFEYQSMIAAITGMDIANCSLYDGTTAIAEAMLMAIRIKRKKNTFLIPKHICWEKKSVLQNYAKGTNITIKEISYDQNTGYITPDQLKNLIDKTVCGVYIENPNYFGIFEEHVTDLAPIIHDAGSLFIVGIDPLSLGIIQDPGAYGADIVVGEGRNLGNHMDYGGSSLGLFSCKKEYLRQMPGRLIGKTTDSKGNPAYCMTLQTREQHIRRGRATSNICTNEGLCALAASVYLSWLGGTGLQNLAETNFNQGQILADSISTLKGYEKAFTGTHFNECVIKTTTDAHAIQKALLKKGIQAGPVIETSLISSNQYLLFGITETHTTEDIDSLTTVLKEVAHV